MLDVAPASGANAVPYQDYIITPPTIAPADADIPASTNTDLVVYCVDVSGSMGVTTAVPSLQAEWKRLRDKDIASPSTSYISRLECIQVCCVC